jgi:hypothetical protein
MIPIICFELRVSKATNKRPQWSFIVEFLFLLLCEFQDLSDQNSAINQQSISNQSAVKLLRGRWVSSALYSGPVLFISSISNLPSGANSTTLALDLSNILPSAVQAVQIYKLED